MSLGESLGESLAFFLGRKSPQKIWRWVIGHPPHSVQLRGHRRTDHAGHCAEGRQHTQDASWSASCYINIIPWSSKLMFNIAFINTMFERFKHRISSDAPDKGGDRSTWLFDSTQTFYFH